MRKIAVLAIIATMVAAAQAGIILDHITPMVPNKYDKGNGNHEGGSAIFGKNYGLAVGTPFQTTSTEYIITCVEVANVTFGVELPKQAVVEIYNFGAGGPDDRPLYRGTHDVKNTGFSDSIFGLVGVISSAENLSITLNPQTTYMVVLQTISRDWAYTVRDSNGPDAWLRDQSSFGYQGGYGFTTWRSGQGSGFGFGRAAYRLCAVPEPTALVLLALGALGLIRRR